MSSITSMLNTGLLSANSLLTNNLKAEDKPTSLLDILEASNPEKAELLRKEQEKSNRIIDQLKSIKSDAAEMRKAKAQEDIERLKKQILALKMMGGLNPEATARLAARLSRELAAAAKAYVSAGGGNAGALPSVPNPASDATSSETSTSTPVALTNETSEKSVPTVEKTDSEAGLKHPTNHQVGETDVEGTVVGENDKIKFLENIHEQVNDLKNSASVNEEDQKFVNDVRNLMTQLKAIIETANQKKKRDEGKEMDPSNQDIKGAKKAFREIEQALDDISTNMLDKISSNTSSVSTVTKGAVTTNISINITV